MRYEKVLVKPSIGARLHGRVRCYQLGHYTSQCENFTMGFYFYLWIFMMISYNCIKAGHKISVTNFENFIVKDFQKG